MQSVSIRNYINIYIYNDIIYWKNNFQCKKKKGIPKADLSNNVEKIKELLKNKAEEVNESEVPCKYKKKIIIYYKHRIYINIYYILLLIINFTLVYTF